MFSMLTYFFGHPIFFARLCHVNPLCKHKQQNLQRKESSDQKMQENKPVLELKNTGKKVYQKLKWKKNIFHCTLIDNDAHCPEDRRLICKTFHGIPLEFLWIMEDVINLPSFRVSDSPPATCFWSSIPSQVFCLCKDTG